MRRKMTVILIILAILAVLAVALFFLTREKETINPALTQAPTAAPVETPTAEPTVEPTVEAEPTVEITPTEAPVVETTPTEVPAEPTEEPVCSHKDTTTFLAEETMEECKYQEICSVCNEVVKEYTVEKEVPEPTPEPTATPVPTSTPLPTSTPTPLPTATPVPTKAPCNHEETATYLKEETDTEYINKVVCENCGEVVEEFSVPKATPTPTPKPTEKPLPTPTPVPNRAEVVSEHTDDDGDVIIKYADRTKTTIWAEGKCPSVDPRKYETPISYKTNYTKKQIEVNGKIREVDSIISKEYLGRFDYETHHDEVVEFYIYSYYDGETDTWTTRLVNSDGSFNRYSENVIDGLADVSNCIYGMGDNGWYLEMLAFGVRYEEDYVLSPDDFLYHKDGVIRLYEY